MRFVSDHISDQNSPILRAVSIVQLIVLNVSDEFKDEINCPAQILVF